MDLYPYDPAEDLKDPAEQKILLDEAFASGDQKFIAKAIGTIARARGMSEVAGISGLSRATLYKALSETGDPRLSTLLGVMQALGFELVVKQHTLA